MYTLLYKKNEIKKNVCAATTRAKDYYTRNMARGRSLAIRRGTEEIGEILVVVVVVVARETRRIGINGATII